MTPIISVIATSVLTTILVISCSLVIRLYTAKKHKDEIRDLIKSCDELDDLLEELNDMTAELDIKPKSSTKH